MPPAASAAAPDLAVILAGGLGTRLAPVLPGRQKVAAEIGGKPFLGYMVDALHRAGVRRVLLAAGYRAEQIEEMARRLSRPGLRIDVVVEAEPLGTGGALLNCLGAWGAARALVLNGDTFVNADLGALAAFHASRPGAKASLLLVPAAAAGRFGVPDIDEQGRIQGFAEKAREGRQWVNGGIYIIEAAALDVVPRQFPCSLERDIFPRWCGDGLFGFKQEAPFIDIGTPESFAEAEDFLGHHARTAAP